MRTGRVLVASLVLALVPAACAADGGDGNDATGDTVPATGCPVEPAAVSDRLGYDVRVHEATATESACRYEPVDAAAHPGAHVLVVLLRLAEGGLAAAQAAVETDAGPTRPLPVDAIDDAQGWVAQVGRVVQVGAARGRRLVQVTVADAALEADAAETAAVALAADALG